MSRLSILIVDPSALFRTGLRTWIEQMPDVGTVLEAADGAGALELADLEQPDLVLTELSLPLVTGIELAEAIRRDFNDTRVIMMSLGIDRPSIRRTLRAGALGYVVKDASRLEFELAIAAALRNQTFLSPAVASLVVEDLMLAETPVASVAVSDLSPRQEEVLRLAASGLSTKQIARRLGISFKTAQTHRSLLMMRLGVHSLAELVQFAVRARLIEPDLRNTSARQAI